MPTGTHPLPGHHTADSEILSRRLIGRGSPDAACCLLQWGGDLRMNVLRLGLASNHEDAGLARNTVSQTR